MNLRFHSRHNLLRTRGGHDGHRVAFSELFFDLVFVFAITQLSHGLLEHFTWTGTVQTAFLFMAVWWVWVYTSWVTNWLDPQRTAVRLMLYTLMFAGLFLSTAIPEAFGERGLQFALAYAAMQCGRTAFCCWAVRGHHDGNYRNFLRILVWLCVSGVLWIAGGLAQDGARATLWVAALAIEYAGPALYFRVPGLGRSALADWDISGAHLAERCGLFIIIALGESVLMAGTTFGHMALTPLTVGSFAVAFGGTVAMWWVYFNIGAERAAHVIADAADPGRLARLAYTYIHMLLAAGVVLTAVGDEMLLAHPLGHPDIRAGIALAGGPLLFLLGNALFKQAVFGLTMLSHIAGCVALAALIAAGAVLPPLPLAGMALAVLMVVAGWETVACGEKTA